MRSPWPMGRGHDPASRRSALWTTFAFSPTIDKRVSLEGIEAAREEPMTTAIASRRDILKHATGLVALGLCTGLAPRGALAAREMTAREKELYEAAKKEGELTWYTAHSDDVTAQALGRDFEGMYPGIRANVVRTTAQVAFQRVSQEVKAGAMQVDVLSSTDMGHCVYLKEKGLLEKYLPENASRVLDIYKNYDPDGYYHVTSAGLIGIGYNTGKLK